MFTFFDVFRKAEQSEPPDTLEFLQRTIFLLFLFPSRFLSSLSLSLVLFHRLSSSQRAVITVIARAHSTICLSIIFTGEGILVGAQLRYIDGRQVHRHRFRRQEGHRLRDRIRMSRIWRRVRGYQLAIPWKIERSPRVLSGAVTTDDVIPLLVLFVIAVVTRSLTKERDRRRKAEPNGRFGSLMIVRGKLKKIWRTYI